MPSDTDSGPTGGQDPAPAVTVAQNKVLQYVKSPWVGIIVVVLPALITTWYDARARSLELQTRQEQLESRKGELEEKTTQIESSIAETKKDSAVRVARDRSTSDGFRDAVVLDIENIYDRLQDIETSLPNKDAITRAKAHRLFGVDIADGEVEAFDLVIRSLEAAPPISKTASGSQLSKLNN